MAETTCVGHCANERARGAPSAGKPHAAPPPDLSDGSDEDDDGSDSEDGDKGSTGDGNTTSETAAASSPTASDARDAAEPRGRRELLVEHVIWAHAALAARVFNYQSVSRAGIVGEHHYDEGNDFYATWLDPDMQYSCAHWKNH